MHFESKTSLLTINDLTLIALSNRSSYVERRDDNGSELIIPISGTAITSIGREDFEIKNNGMAFFCSAETRRTLKTGTSLVKIRLSIDKLNSIHKSMVGKRKTQVEFKPSRFYSLNLKDVSFMELFLSAFNQIDLVNGDQNILTRISFDDTIYRLCAAVIFNDVFESEQTSAAATVDSRYEIRRLCEWMNANLTKPISLTDMERISGLSSRVIQYCFQKYFGMRPKEWLRKQRLHAARAELIRSSRQQKITCIAYDFCFPSSSNFAEHYKIEFGELPIETRRGGGGKYRKPFIN
jgi:AraC-like DNA-binding protein